MPYRTIYMKNENYFIWESLKVRNLIIKVNTYLYTTANNIRPNMAGFIESGRSRFRS